MTVKNYIAVDLGAESGRVMLGAVSDDKVVLEEVHRFGNGPIEIDGALHWDFSKTLAEIKTGIGKAVEQTKGEVACIAVDSWGVDFGLLDAEGRLLEDPYHYRDNRTDGMLEKAFEIVGKRAIYDRTGIQFMQLNTLYQLLAMQQSGDPILKQAKTLLFTADLYAYHLCGKAYAEYSLASTSQAMDMKTGQWTEDIFEKLHLPLDIMPSVVQPGTIVGELTKEVAAEFNSPQIPVAAIGSHDTASAVAAVPASAESGWAYLSCGTWSLLGVEIPKPVISDETFEYQFTNEGGVNGTIRLLKNIMGLWLVQECRRHWQTEGQELSYAELTEMARKAAPFAAYIDPSHSAFLSPGKMPDKINDCLAQTGQKPIDDKGTMIRAILESLALNYAWVLQQIEAMTGNPIDSLHLVGGGIQNELLCQFAADATGKQVIAGPVEATATGNILMQAKATGQVESMKQIRQIVRNSFDVKEYLPKDSSAWQVQSEKYKPIS
ncbi:MAG: rhamnulokinase family protein [Planctomycetota bacterium]